MQKKLDNVLAQLVKKEISGEPLQPRQGLEHLDYLFMAILNNESKKIIESLTEIMLKKETIMRKQNYDFLKQFMDSHMNKIATQTCEDDKTHPAYGYRAPERVREIFTPLLLHNFLVTLSSYYIEYLTKHPQPFETFQATEEKKTSEEEKNLKNNIDSVGTENEKVPSIPTKKNKARKRKLQAKADKNHEPKEPEETEEDKEIYNQDWSDLAIQFCSSFPWLDSTRLLVSELHTQRFLFNPYHFQRFRFKVYC